MTRTNVLPPYEIEVSEDVAMTQAPGSPARSIQMDSPFVEENSLQVLSTFSTLFELSLGADLNNDLDKFSPSYQPLHFDDSSLTLPRRDLGSLEGLLPHSLYTPPAFSQFTANGLRRNTYPKFRDRGRRMNYPRRHFAQD